jgi:radical SAM protein with 4Fe4S-binding SPASM domain
VADDFMPPAEFPHLVDGLAVRLAEQGCQLRRLETIDDVVELHGSAAAFLERCDGQRTAAAIIDEVTALAGVPRETIAADFAELAEGLERRGLLARAAAPVAGAARGYLGVVAPFVRSTIHIDITHRCNERCVHCLVPRDGQEIAFAALLELLQQAAAAGFVGLAFSGGEPFLHPHFWDLLARTRDLGFYFTLFTNGLLALDEAAIARLAAFEPEQVRISVYSMDPAVHDGMTQVPGSHARTLRSILALKEAGVRLYINSPISIRNYDDFRAIAAFADGHGFERNLDPVIQPTRDRSDFHQELQLSYEQAKDVTGFQQSAPELVVNVQPGRPVCNVGDDPSVDASLNLYPCPGVRLALGNLRERRLEELLDHPTLAELRALSLDNLTVCQRCNVRDGCYRCHGHPYQEGGDYRGCSTLDRRQAQIRRELMVERGTRKA